MKRLAFLFFLISGVVPTVKGQSVYHISAKVCPNVPETLPISKYDNEYQCDFFPVRDYNEVTVVGATSHSFVQGRLVVLWPLNSNAKQVTDHHVYGSCEGMGSTVTDIYTVSLKIPAHRPPIPTAANISARLCPGATDTLRVDPIVVAGEGGEVEYVWKYNIVGEPGETMLGVTTQPEYRFTVPANLTAGTQIRFSVRSQYTICKDTYSDWLSLGNWTVSETPPLATIGRVTSRICSTNASVEVNITNSGTTANGVFMYSNTDGTNNGDGQRPFSGVGRHAILIPFSSTTGQSFTFAYQLAGVIDNGDGTTSLGACTTNGFFTMKDSSYTLSMVATGIDERCSGTVDGAVNLTVSNGKAPFTYAWTTSAPGGSAWTTENLAGLPGGATYSVTARDSHGCTGTASAEVERPAPVAIGSAYLSSNHSGWGVSCHADNTGGTRNDGRITIEATGGTGQLRYQLVGANHTVPYQAFDTVGNLYADTYIVYVRDSNNCERTYSQPVEVTTPPAITYTDISKTDLICAGVPTGELVVNGAAGGTGILRYSSDDSRFQEEPVFGNLPAGTHTLTMRDEHGCTRQGSVTLTQPPAMVFGAVASTAESCVGHLDGEISLLPASGGTGARRYSLDGEEYIAESPLPLFAGLASANYTIYMRDDSGCVVTQSYFVNIRPAITATISETQVVSCHGIADGALAVTSAGGTGQHDYTWSNGVTGPGIGGLAGDVEYTVSVRDDKGCVSTFSHDLGQPGLLTSSAVLSDYTGFGVRCNGAADGTIDLTVAGGMMPFGYRWSNGSGSEDLSALVPGSYSVTVTDAHGCETNLENLEITEPAAFGLAVGRSSDVLCHGGSDGEVLLVAAGGAAGYTYAVNGTWQESSLFNTLTVGAYVFQVRDANGCTAQTEAILRQPDALLLELVSKSETTCNEANGSATVLASGGVADYTYTWYDESAMVYARGAAVTALRSGDYQVVAEDTHACQTALRVVMNDSDGPAITREELTALTCFESNDGMIRVSVAGGLAPYDVSWDMAGETGTTVTNVTGGEHWVEVHDAKGCRVKEFFNVLFPEELKVGYTLATPSCQGYTDGRIEIAATGGNAGPYSYVWSTGEITMIREGLAAGSYTVTVTDVRDCAGHQTIVVTDPAKFIVDAGGDRTICVGQKVAIRAKEDHASYQWASTKGFTSTNREVTLQEPATYTLTVISARGCEASDSFVIRTSNDLLQADFLMASEAYAGDTVVVVDISWPVPDRLTWTLPEGASLNGSGDAYGEIVFAAPGEYDIVLNTYLGECIADLTRRITILDGAGGNEAGRTPESVIAGFEVYPNPNHGRFTVAVALREAAAVAHVRMLAVTGSRRFFEAEVRGNGEYYYQGSVLPAGIYLVVLDAGKETKMKRVVIE